MEGIKSKERVQEHGEVFTPDSIVNDMLDLVDEELNKEDAWGYIDKTYLEPACGNGNFLLRILDRKLEVAQKALPREQWDLALVRSLSTIYGIDIQGDNVRESKNRIIELIKNGSVPLLELADTEVKPFHFEKYNVTPELNKIMQFVLDNNIQQGNCLTGTKWRGNNDTSELLLISEYKWNNDRVSRREVALNNCISEGNIMYDHTEAEYEEVNYMSLDSAKSLNSEQNGQTGLDAEFDF
jgi:hypothetical protein